MCAGFLGERELAEQILDEAVRPLRVRDVVSALAELTDMCHDPASVRKALHDGTRADVPRFHRVGWGLYASAIGRQEAVASRGSDFGTDELVRECSD